jgi:hypothetical protein
MARKKVAANYQSLSPFYEPKEMVSNTGQLWTAAPELIRMFEPPIALVIVSHVTMRFN